MSPVATDTVPLDAERLHFYQSVLDAMRDAGPPFLVGGAYALAVYTGIIRHTKDIDVFVRPADAGRALDTLAGAGWRTEVTFAHWLGKAFGREDFVDVIFCSGNGLCAVDDAWFEHAVEAVVLDRPVRLCPPEEILWQKAFIQERERFDGADVAHLLRAHGRTLDWRRLLARFGPHWPVLFSHLILFGYLYPSEKDCIPAAVLETLTDRWQERATKPESEPEPLCRGVLLSRLQYLSDLERGGYRDVRLAPWGNLSAAEVKAWTDAAFGH